MKAERCQAVTKSGKPCSATVVADGMCAWHAPSWDDRRRQWSAKGGASRSNAARARKALPAGILTVDEVRAVLGTALKDVLSGALEPGPANAAAVIARSYLAATEASAVEALERDVAELRDLMTRRGLG
jgi:hypothetical protein